MADEFSGLALVDTVDACHLRCPTCIRGVRGLPNTPTEMTLDMLSRILDKLRTEGYGGVEFGNWTEPFLDRALQDHVARVKAKGLACAAATTFALPHIENLEATLRAGIDRISVTLSGATQRTYQVNHVGGTLARVFHHLIEARGIIRRYSLSTQMVIRFLEFDYNAGERPAVRDVAGRLGFRFEVLPAVGHPASSLLRDRDDLHFRRESEAAAGRPSPEDRGQVCPLAFDQIAIDCRGDVFLCGAMPNFASLRIGPYLDLPAPALLRRRHGHPFCRACSLPRRQARAGDRARLVTAGAP
jgi:MoaA/NifB/PqqE/SkfB family radical SAM enzyme